MRGSQVIYDRANSSFASMKPGDIDWKTIFQDATWFHWTGITPAISENTAAICLEGIKIAHESGLTVSCDMNFRAKLWKWGKSAKEIMQELLKYCDVAIGNEEDAEKVFGIKAPNSNILSGQVDANSYMYVCDQLAKLFPNLKTIAITLRGSISADQNTWSGILWNSNKYFTAPNYSIGQIVDRVGAGDSFMGGLIYGLTTYPTDNQKAINFAVAASAFKHTIFGDFNLVTTDEVEKLIKGDESGRISR
jgi:2-dehydro-3-deoxygluconokinase